MLRSTTNSPTSLRAGSHKLIAKLRLAIGIVVQHTTKHTGVGMICAVAYFDPGNWGVDLQAGSQFGYKLLFIVLLSGVFAVYMQVLASRLGCVTGLDLASHCRLLLHDRPRHTLIWRWLVLYPLYALAEVAIISTDLAELLGSAIALCLLFPKMPLWAGVLLTASDVLLLLAFRDPLAGRPVRMFELLIAALVFTVLVCMAVIISKANVGWGDAFDGFVPSSAIVKSGGLYTSVGILGATVMPHSLFLGSALATQDREFQEPVNAKETEPLTRVKSNDSIESYIEAPLASIQRHSHPKTILKKVGEYIRSLVRVERFEDSTNGPRSHAERDNNTLIFVKAHIYHGIVDMVISLLCIAVVINALILILANRDSNPASLFDAYDLLHDRLGKPAAILFALALLFSGQSSSIVATLAGQTVSEGFIQWRMSATLRRFLTRCLGLIPSMGISTLLVISQVVLSIVLPFIVFPLIWLTSSKNIMREFTILPAEGVAEAGEVFVDFSNNKFMICVGWMIWTIIVVANVYAIVSLGMGET
ncbi:smf Mn2+ and Fe2+ transporter-like protein [Amylocystis lapponica]|nr:smf Mn2+ and Fe2+ transporter-like protein [Amylocystis lapponica]